MNRILNLICDCCNKSFTRTKHSQSGCVKSKLTVCSTICRDKLHTKKQEFQCVNCKVLFLKQPCKISKNNFCSRSCSATYNNTHKSKGTKISKLEKWLANELVKLYPNLDFHFNRKDAINSELDIYIPSLRLAFELNGIFHYEPIYGKEKLSQIKNNDTRKFQACLENGISLCIIDTSKLINFKKEKAKEYLKIIQNIIILH